MRPLFLASVLGACHGRGTVAVALRACPATSLATARLRVQVVGADGVVEEERSVDNPGSGVTLEALDLRSGTHSVRVTGLDAGGGVRFYGESVPRELDPAGDASVDVIVAEPDSFCVASETLLHARAGHTATLLGDGTVLLAGGLDGHGDPVAETEVFDPATSHFTAGPSLRVPRAFHAAVPVGDGVLLVGGVGAGGMRVQAVERWTPDGTTAGGMLAPARAHAAAASDGGVAIAYGGIGAPDSVAEVDGQGRVTPVECGGVCPPMSAPTATTLANGGLLFLGCDTPPPANWPGGDTPACFGALWMGDAMTSFVVQSVACGASCDPFVAAARPRRYHASARVDDGDASLIVTYGGYDPTAGGAGTVLGDAYVLVCDGACDRASAPLTLALAPIGSVGLAARCTHTMTPVRSPRGTSVLVVGGFTNAGACQLVDGALPPGATVAEHAALLDLFHGDGGFEGLHVRGATNGLPHDGEVARALHTATPLPDGTVLIAGGCGPGCAQVLDDVARFVPGPRVRP